MSSNSQRRPTRYSLSREDSLSGEEPPCFPDSPPEDGADIINSELKQRLSPRRRASTTAPTAEYHRAASQNVGTIDSSFTKIGAGACGIVFSQDGTSLAIKLAKTDDEFLSNDYEKHKKIADEFKKYDLEGVVKVPACYDFTPRGNQEYFTDRPGLAKAADPICHLPTSVLTTQRILPLPQATRTLLIKKYCAPRGQTKALDDPANNDCLVRTWSTKGKSAAMFFSLRNFKLHLNQMAEIRLNVNEIGRRMAVAMAIMHWGARTDARDVEFVLGSSADKMPYPLISERLRGLTLTDDGPLANQEDFFHRTTEFFVLDFNQVRDITLDETGVDLAVDAAKMNDPYLEASATILEEGGYNEDKNVLGLPGKFLDGLVEIQRKKQEVAEPKDIE